ncbi:hypothetical protein PROFUN_07260 [Planoprotostelium fungivorum]|uniref:Uncharacterized protein n=1 Tax=Planoprotostelium fungivorum TaxID=1890364 RepID=A0A2P6NM82_9EUKA|nr:hypothetical protein PROFUN_07260 [Planoprotostelium fungivorum]
MANVEKLASTQTIGRHCQGESGAIPYIHFTPQLYQTAQRRGTLLYIDLIPSSIVQGQYGTLDDVLKHSAYQYTPQAITSNPFRLNVKLPQITIQNNRWRLLLRLHAGADLLAYAASTSFELSSTSVAPQIMQTGTRFQKQRAEGPWERYEGKLLDLILSPGNDRLSPLVISLFEELHDQWQM